MKVVLYKSPKFLGGILRMLFKVKKVENQLYIKAPNFWRFFHILLFSLIYFTKTKKENKLWI